MLKLAKYHQIINTKHHLDAFPEPAARTTLHTEVNLLAWVAAEENGQARKLHDFAWTMCCMRRVGRGSGCGGMRS